MFVVFFRYPITLCAYAISVLGFALLNLCPLSKSCCWFRVVFLASSRHRRLPCHHPSWPRHHQTPTAPCQLICPAIAVVAAKHLAAATLQHLAAAAPRAIVTAKVPTAANPNQDCFRFVTEKKRLFSCCQKDSFHFGNTIKV